MDVTTIYMAKVDVLELIPRSMVVVSDVVGSAKPSSEAPHEAGTFVSIHEFRSAVWDAPELTSRLSRDVEMPFAAPAHWSLLYAAQKVLRRSPSSTQSRAGGRRFFVPWSS